MPHNVTEGYGSYLQIGIEDMQITGLLEQLTEGNLLTHSERVAYWSRSISTAMNLPSPVIEQASIAGTLHDIGKLGVPTTIVEKPSELTLAEWSVMRTHPEQGFRMVVSHVHKDIALAVRHHHERFDGLGYPFGLPGTTIPLVARILSVADAFDAMTSDRSYKLALSDHFAVRELLDHSGTQFDPTIVDAMVDLVHGQVPVAA